MVEKNYLYQILRHWPNSCNFWKIVRY